MRDEILFLRSITICRTQRYQLWCSPITRSSPEYSVQAKTHARGRFCVGARTLAGSVSRCAGRLPPERKLGDNAQAVTCLPAACAVMTAAAALTVDTTCISSWPSTGYATDMQWRRRQATQQRRRQAMSCIICEPHRPQALTLGLSSRHTGPRYCARWLAMANHRHHWPMIDLHSVRFV